MSIGLIARKAGMTQNLCRRWVLLYLLRCSMLSLAKSWRVGTADKDGYDAVQVGFGAANTTIQIVLFRAILPNRVRM